MSSKAIYSMDSLVVKFVGAIHKSINDLMCITESMKTSVDVSPAQGLMRRIQEVKADMYSQA